MTIDQWTEAVIYAAFVGLTVGIFVGFMNSWRL